MKKHLLLSGLLLTTISLLQAQNIQNNSSSNHANKFEQLGTILPTPNEQRTASGTPGPKYWQQRVDYDIKCELDESGNKLTGSETITYFNNSPETLSYFWMQLDENQHSTVNNANYQTQNTLGTQYTDKVLDRFEEKKGDNGYGVNITKLVDAAGKPIKYTINKTMMKVDLAVPLKPGQKFVFKVDWNYKIVNRGDFIRFGGARGGYENFPEDNNNNYTMTQWYPRLCKYSDDQGWQNHQFTGTGEFTLCFGNFKVQMTVPADHIVGATGECQNYAQTLSPTQMARWNKAQTAKEPLQIVTLEEALKASKQKSAAKKTWIYKADNVRDFAWTSSRRFVWDAMPAMIEGKKAIAMSYYAKEAYPIYSKYSTKAVAHTLKTYSKFSIPYPYPVAISVEGNQGMEYPMISFNPGRALPDGSYSEGAKNAAILVIIHEVGHTFFPMIVNSDERQWTWMDEGLNSYMQYLAQELWDNKFPSDGGVPSAITDYMKLPKDQLEPIMTNSENINNFGANAYDKVATGLNILRETIVGRELFDNAFREYAKRWAFKSPTPADLFRTLEDATGEDLDWFWRGWFYGTDACDISIDTVKYAVPDVTAVPQQTKDTTVYRPLAKPAVNEFEDLSKIRNKTDNNIVFETDKDTTLRDFYWRYARDMEKYDTTKYPIVIKPQTEALDEEGRKKYGTKHMYEVAFSNKGGLVMPIILEWTYKDGTKEIERIPAQVWRKNEKKVVKTFLKDKEVASIKLDPYKETADVDESNNTYGDIKPPNKFKVFKQKQNVAPPQGINPMQKAMEKKGF
ncbi:MAG: M1 family metallopeptidase [Chitinophagaceae bacterium]|nr:M1 family metallopeptidase [Chitinophagaceae bacterium]MBK7680488.1 M1 family metallopeptidase [Chitinophagaceae bacterium]MBK8300713.1 M1 family metallopeptidase [Chitinophagaceae bacterium]MBK9465792.1 M1 family metallopeptidase [Chitinophagaceae bacterium]MBK9661012.1 M1 family metallopeptidase [Chitinophagaceae bacterium]